MSAPTHSAHFNRGSGEIGTYFEASCFNDIALRMYAGWVPYFNIKRVYVGCKIGIIYYNARTRRSVDTYEELAW